MQLSDKDNTAQGWWQPGSVSPEQGEDAVRKSILRVIHPVCLLNLNDQIAVGRGGTVTIGAETPPDSEHYPLIAYAPSLHPQNLGDPDFRKAYKLRYAYVAGAMANGITSVEMVEETARAGMIGFFGAAGLLPDEIEDAIERLQQTSADLPFGFNLINSPADPELEASVVLLYLKRGIRRISASAYMELTLPLVYFRIKGIRRDNSGNIVCPNSVFAKVSRVEVARKFFSPAPDKLLAQLVDRRLITEEEAALAANIPMADALTAEADSGGHTDNRPAISLLPTMLALRDELTEQFGYDSQPYVGLGGGIATPESAAAAFAMGAAYILTGSINQSCVEAGTSMTVRQMLAEAGQADVTMAPSADMFEMGVKVQVLKRGTLFPPRANKLYDLYSRYNGMDQIPDGQLKILERDIFRCSQETEWKETKKFFSQRDPKQILRAEEDPRHKMALLFRAYLGRSSTWAKLGEADRKIDYQIWCGPAMGAFNQWAKGSFLESPENRKTVTVAMNLLLGASVITRVNWLRSQGAALPVGIGKFSPMTLSDIANLLEADRAV